MKGFSQPQVESLMELGAQELRVAHAAGHIMLCH